jgi:hypothetical protein
MERFMMMMMTLDQHKSDLWHEGRRAYENGIYREDNPYAKNQLFEYHWWDCGWIYSSHDDKFLVDNML